MDVRGSAHSAASGGRGSPSLPMTSAGAPASSVTSYTNLLHLFVFGPKIVLPSRKGPRFAAFVLFRRLGDPIAPGLLRGPGLARLRQDVTTVDGHPARPLLLLG